MLVCLSVTSYGCQYCEAPDASPAQTTDPVDDPLHAELFTGTLNVFAPVGVAVYCAFRPVQPLAVSPDIVSVMG